MSTNVSKGAMLADNRISRALDATLTNLCQSQFSTGVVTSHQIILSPKPSILHTFSFSHSLSLSLGALANSDLPMLPRARFLSSPLKLIHSHFPSCATSEQRFRRHKTAQQRNITGTSAAQAQLSRTARTCSRHDSHREHWQGGTVRNKEKKSTKQ